MRPRITHGIALGLAVLAASCVRQTRVAAAPAPRPQTVWDRQIKNASDAGDGDYQLRVLRERVAEDANSVPARLELAEASRQRGFADVALEMCRLAVARFPESGEARLALVRGLYDLKRPQEAIGALEPYLATHPKVPAEYHSWLGLLRDAAGEWTGGEPAHRKALELAPSQDALHNNLGYNLLMQKRNEEAAGEFREALRLNPGSQVARNNLGLALANQNAAEQAVASWRSASDDATAHNNLAAVWIEKGNYAAARKELQIALGYNVSHPAALRNLELVSRLDGNPATLGPEPVERSVWERWKAGFIRLWVGPLDDSRAERKPPANPEKK